MNSKMKVNRILKGRLVQGRFIITLPRECSELFQKGDVFEVSDRDDYYLELTKIGKDGRHGIYVKKVFSGKARNGDRREYYGLNLPKDYASMFKNRCFVMEYDKQYINLYILKTLSERC